MALNNMVRTNISSLPGIEILRANRHVLSPAIVPWSTYNSALWFFDAQFYFYNIIYYVQLSFYTEYTYSSLTNEIDRENVEISFFWAIPRAHYHLPMLFQGGVQTSHWLSTVVESQASCASLGHTWQTGKLVSTNNREYETHIQLAVDDLAKGIHTMSPGP